jgi:NhaP-type Na+/H+ or K+/H+ antiporter
MPGRTHVRHDHVVTATAFTAIALLVFAWAIGSGMLARRNVTGPMVFAAAGYLLSNPDWGPIGIVVETESIRLVAEVTLALVLFSDAARVNLLKLRHDLSLPGRLLAIGLPLSVLSGWALAAVLLPDLPWALAAFLGASLAPTDAALSVHVINDERIPGRLRRALNVESGLNDGIATPIVTVTLAIAASQLGIVGESEAYELGAALRELGAGTIIGIALGAGGGAILTWSSRRAWIAEGGHRIATLAIALGAYSLAHAVDANGFIAAFVAGVAFGAALDHETVDAERAIELPELGGETFALAVWYLFGAALVPIVVERVDVRIGVFAVLALTVLRLVPVALCLARSGLDGPSVLFIGWFGPRGLASVVFALLAIERLGDTSAEVGDAVAAVALTVLLSVVLHGISAGPGGRRYLRAERRVPGVAR